MNKLSRLTFAAIFSLFTFLTFAEEPLKTAIVDISDVTSVVYINKADEHRLISLIGIGRTKAAAIIEYRKMNGKFTSVNDLLKVKGIGQNILDKNAQRLKI